MWPPGYSGRMFSAHPVVQVTPAERPYHPDHPGYRKYGKSVLQRQLFQYRVKLVTVRTSPLHEQHHFPVSKIDLCSVAEAEPAGCCFLLSHLCVCCRLSCPCGHSSGCQSRSISARVDACVQLARKSRTTDSDLTGNMFIIIILPFSQ